MNNTNTPDPMFAKFDQILGKTTPTTSNGPVSTWADELRGKAPHVQPATQGQQAAADLGLDQKPAITANTEDAFKSGLDNAKAGFQRTQAAAADKGPGSSTLGSIGNMIGGAGQMAAGGIQAVASPIAGAVKTAGDIAGISNPAGSAIDYVASKANDLMPWLQKLATDHPHLADDANSAITILGTLAGAEKAPEIGSALQGGLETGTAAARGTAQAIDQGAASVAGKIGEARQAVTSSLEDSAAKSAKSDWAKPTTKTAGSYSTATDIYNNAKSSGHDISDTLVKSGVKLSDNVSEGKYDTANTADRLRSESGKLSNELLRPSLEKANAVTVPTPVSDIISSAKSNLADNKFIPQETKDILMKKLDSTSPALEKQYPNGMNLTDLHDEKILRSKNAKMSPVGDISTNLEANKNYALSNAMKTELEASVPKDIPVKEFNAQLQKNYQAADYIESLNGKKVPIGIGTKAIRAAAKGVGAIAGSHLGIGGAFGGYSLGGIVENMAEGLPASLRDSLLKNVESTNPEAFDRVRGFLGQETNPKDLVHTVNTSTGDIPKEAPQEMNMGTYKIGKNPNTGIVEPTGHYRSPVQSFYPPKAISPTEMGTYKLGKNDSVQYRSPKQNFYTKK